MYLRVSVLLLGLCFSLPGGASFKEAQQAPHLRAFLKNIYWVMSHIVEDVESNDCPVSDKQYVTATDQNPYREFGTPDRYFSSALLKQTTCDIQLTLNTSITAALVPGFALGKKILLTPEIVTINSNKYYYWECKTNLDPPQFQGASVTANDASIISYFPENLFVGNCVYVASPF